MVYKPITLITFFIFFLGGTVFAASQSNTRFYYSGNGSINLRSAKNVSSFHGKYRNPDGTYDKNAIKKINRVFGANADILHKSISLRFIEFLDYLQDHFKGGTITITSGYRSPTYNTNLRKNGALAGKASMHQYGMASDIKMAGVSSKKIWEYVRELKFGGAGYYHGANVHVDVGPARWWDENTSKVGTDIADDNKLIMIFTDKDIYYPNETIFLGFARMTAWPIGVNPEFILERVDAPDVKNKKFVPEFFPNQGCHIYNDLPTMQGIKWQLPKNQDKGKYRIKVRFCNKEWTAMPDEIVTSDFEIKDVN